MQSQSNLRLFFFLTLFTTTASYAQTNCALETLTGAWKETVSISGIQTNIDSLKRVATTSGNNLGVWNFNADNRYTYKHPFHRSKYRRKGSYLLKNAPCEIILGKKARAHERANLEILYADDAFLIYKSDNNPKGYFTHVLIRHKKKSEQ